MSVKKILKNMKGRRVKALMRILIISILILGAVVAAIVFGLQKNEQKDNETDKDVEVMATIPDEQTKTDAEETTIEETTTQESITQKPTTVPQETEAPTFQEYPGGFVFEETGDTRYAYLTFDDGPSNNTYAILDILDQYGVKATFFVNGREDAVSLERYKAIADRGHSLAMHSYTHEYDEIYASLEAFQADTARIHDLLYKITGQDIRLYRFPGGSSNTISAVDMQVYMDYLTSIGYVYYDWNVSSGDATGQPITAAEIVYNVVEQAKSCTRAMILMHDGNKKGETVAALPAMIEGLQKEGFQIVAITDKTKPIQHRKASYMQQPTQ